MLASTLAARVASADSIDELTKALASSSDKARLAAVTSLAQLEDKRTLKPLVTALHDPNPQVRTLAAKALGRLGHKAALPALRTAATDDPDDNVKIAARAAALAVARTNGIPADLPATTTSAAPAVEARTGRPGFGHSPRAVDHPDLYVVMNSASDDSPGKHDKAARKQHGEILKAALATRLKTAPLVTVTPGDASRWGLDPRHVDLSVVKMEVNTAGTMVEVEAQLRLAISDDKGRMMSFLSGGAKVQVPKRTFNPTYLPNLRKEALEQAMNGMFEKLIAQMRKTDA